MPCESQAALVAFEATFRALLQEAAITARRHTASTV
jgi:hypothetical protein